MSASRSGKMVPTGLGFRAVRGGSVVVGVVAGGGEPRVVLSEMLSTAAEGDRLSLEPYRVAFEMERGPDGGASAGASAAVAEGRKRQEMLAASGLGEIVGKLRGAGCEPAVAALLVNRAGWIGDLLAYSLSWPEHAPVADGLAVRDAVRFACGHCGVEIAEMDEKSLQEVAAAQLRLPSRDIDVRLKLLGAAIGRPWRKEQKLACLAAWLAVVTRQSA
jgi:hypothetical protein